MTLRGLVGGSLFVEVEGDGAPIVVMLHGWGRDRKDLVGAVEGVQGTRVFVDLPGFGSSPEPPEAWGAREYANLVTRGLRELAALLGLEDAPLVLVGHSFGGRVALCAAADPSTDVSALVLTGVPLLRPGPSRSPRTFRLARSLHRRGLLSEQRMEAMRQRYGSADYRTAQGVMRDTLVRLVAESYEAELAAVQCPTSLVWGALDTAARPEMAHRAAQLLPDSPAVLVVEDVGHDLHRERPDLLGGEIKRLVERVQ